MKNKLKLLIVMVISIIALTGCKATTPTDVVTEYFKEIKNGTNADVSAYLQESVEQSTSQEAATEEVDPKIDEAMKIVTTKIKAKPLSEEIKEDKAVVQVEVEGINLSNIMLEIIGEAFNKAFSGEELTEDDTSNMILEKVKNAQTETRTGKVNLTKVDEKWKIEVDEDLMALILGTADQQ